MSSRQTVLFGLVLMGLIWTASSRSSFAQPQGHGQPFVCRVINSTATTLTAFGGQCAAVPAQALYITDITAASTAISTATADNYPVLKYGTGTNCGTGTTVLWAGYTLTFTTIIANFVTPIRVPQNVDLCWMHAAAGSKHFVITGYVGQ